MNKLDYNSMLMRRRGILLPIVVFLILGIAAVFPLLVSMSETTLKRNQYSEEWARIQWAIEGANQKQIESTATVIDPYSGVMTTVATFTYPESGGSFDVAVIISEGRTLMGRHRNLTATAKAYRNGVDAGYNLSGLAAATVSVPGVAAGGEHSFSWKKDGRLYSWGRNNYGQLGRTGSTATPKQAFNGACPSHDSYYTQGWMVAGGGEHTLALDYYGNVYSWGRNNRGQLGHSGTTNVNVPQTVGGAGSELRECSDLAAGDEFSLALRNDGRVVYWGRIFEHTRPGFLGMPVITTMENNSPTFLPPLSDDSDLPQIVGIDAGSKHALAIDKAGNVFGWGLNSHKQLGAGFSEDYSIQPIKVNHTDSILVSEILYYANNREPGVDSTQFNLAVGHFVGSFSVDVNRAYKDDYEGTGTGWFRTAYDYDVIRLRHVASGSNYDIVPEEDDTSSGRHVWKYDKNQSSKIHLLDKVGTYTVKIIKKKGWWSWFSFKTKETEENANWFLNTQQSSMGVYSFYGRPAEEPTDFFGIAASGDFSMAVRRDGSNTKLYTWGMNDKGQLGHGPDAASTYNRMAPIPNFPPSGERIRTIAAGREHALALTEGGKVYSWGSNANGQLGRTVNTSNPAETPKQVTSTIGGVKITGIAAGHYHSLAVDENGNVYGWGLKTNGRVGYGSTSGNQTTPVKLLEFP